MSAYIININLTSRGKREIFCGVTHSLTGNTPSKYLPDKAGVEQNRAEAEQVKPKQRKALCNITKSFGGLNKKAAFVLYVMQQNIHCVTLERFGGSWSGVRAAASG